MSSGDPKAEGFSANSIQTVSSCAVGPIKVGTDDRDEIARDIAAIGRLEAVPTLLEVLCETTGMGFTAVARLTEETWTLCAVKDEINFGLKPDEPLE